MNSRFILIHKVLFIALLFSLSCARFRVEGLQQRQVLEVKYDKDLVTFPKQSGVVHEVPAQVAVMDNWVVLSVPSERRLIFYKNEKLSLTLEGNPIEKESGNDIKRLYVDQLKIPGRVIAGKSDDIFVETFIPAGSSSVGFYKILHFNLQGELLAVIGREGQPQLPFENILWFDVDTKGNLWVEYRYLGKLIIDNYVNSNLEYQVSEQLCFDRLFDQDKIDTDRYLYRCERMVPFYGGNKVMLIGRVEKNQSGEDGEVQSPFQYRSAVSIDRSGTASEIFNRLSDPEDFPYLTHGEEEILIWQTEDYDQLRFAVYSSLGELQRNYEVRLKSRPQQWRSIYGTIDGRLFGIQVKEESLSIVRWR